MKFVHIADMHFDMPFTLLSSRAGMGEERRIDQRKVFKKMIDYVKENNIPFLFISGDLYEHEYIRESTIQYINNLFEEIPNTRIFISPGNHDPYLKNSYYSKYNWAENVTIFGPEIKRVEFNDVDIYGFGFDDFYCYDSGIREFQIVNKEKLNILVMHASLEGSLKDEKNYNVISEKTFKEKEFDYIALGHIHKRSMEGNIIYPGSMMSHGFDELGKHGMVVGDIEKNHLDLQFIELDEKEFVEEEVDVSELDSVEELVEKINSLKIEASKLYKIILIGKRSFEIDIYKLYKLVENRNIIKIKNDTKIKYDLKEIANDVTLKGIFVKEMLNKLEESSDEDKEIIEKAIEIGMEILS